MPRYFFDIHDGRVFVRDSVGTECSGPEQIRQEAAQTLPLIAQATIPADGDQQAITVLVRDEQNLTVYTATLTFAGLWMGDSPIPEPEPED